MKRATWLIPLALAAACSGRDQSLGETHPAPQPIVIPMPDPQPGPNPNPNPSPNPSPNPDPDPGPSPNPDPNPNPEPEPMPTVPGCEDVTKHLFHGTCLQRADCHAGVFNGVGYECEGDAVCCNDAPGCSANGCGSGGSVMSQGGDGGEPSAGFGGTP